MNHRGRPGGGWVFLKRLEGISAYVARADLHCEQHQSPLRTAVGFYSVLEDCSGNGKLAGRTDSQYGGGWRSDSAASFFATELQSFPDQYSTATHTGNNPVVDQGPTAKDRAIDVSFGFPEEL
jgi:hypothetical protein